MVLSMNVALRRNNHPLEARIPELHFNESVQKVSGCFWIRSAEMYAACCFHTKCLLDSLDLALFLRGRAAGRAKVA